MKILVTGATGTVGANVVKQLVEQGHEVRSQVRPDSQYLHQIKRFETELYPMDLRDRSKYADMVKNVDAILHLAMSGHRNWNSEAFYDVNIGSVLFLMEAVLQHNPNLKRFVNGSSAVLYPNVGFNSRLFTEEDKLHWPVGIYAVSKLTGELLANSYYQSEHLPIVTLSIPEIYCGREILGERLRYVSPFITDHIEYLTQSCPVSAEREACLKALQKHLQDGKKLLIPLTPEGKPWRRHLGDVRDVAAACILALTAPDAIGKTCVIMSDALDFGKGVPHLSKISGLEYAEEYIPFGNCFWFDLEKTHRLLGYRSVIDSERILEDAWRHLHGEDIGIVDGTSWTPIPR